MKNISRRVFIKGMAVAAVATAASTVLTGCKLPVGPEEPEVVPTPANTYTFTADDKTLTFSAPKVETVAYAAGADKEFVYINASVDNGLKKNVAIEDAANDSGETYQIVVGDVYAYDKNGTKTKLTMKSEDLYNTSTAVVVKADSDKEGYMTFNAAIADTWTKIEMDFALYQVIADSTGAHTKAEQVDEFTFTFNK